MLLSVGFFGCLSIHLSCSGRRNRVTSEAVHPLSPHRSGVVGGCLADWIRKDPLLMTYALICEEQATRQRPQQPCARTPGRHGGATDRLRDDVKCFFGPDLVEPSPGVRVPNASLED